MEKVEMENCFERSQNAVKQKQNQEFFETLQFAC